MATLLFVHGFAPTPHVDTDGPDLLVATPGGRLLMVECTLKVADFNDKVSKLAVRRNRLRADLAEKGYAVEVYAALVCAQLRTEMVGVNDEELVRQKIILVTAADLDKAMLDAQHPEDPDDVLVRATAAHSRPVLGSPAQ